MAARENCKRYRTVRGTAALLMVSVMALGVPASAMAQGSPSPKHPTVAKVDRVNAYRRTVKVYFANRKAIQERFNAAINSAHSSFQTAMNLATTSEQRSTARAVLNLAIANAVSARSIALITLGPPPPMNHDGTRQVKTSLRAVARRTTPNRQLNRLISRSAEQSV